MMNEYSLTKVVIDNLELQKSVLIQELHTYKFTNQEEAAVETKQKLDDVEKQLRELRRNSNSNISSRQK